MGPNYAFKPIAEQALGSNQTIVPQRLNAALDLRMKILESLWERVTKWLNIVPTKVRPWDGELLAGTPEELGPDNGYCIEILNDDFTPMEFVVVVLMTCCRLDKERAVELMLEIHTRGKAQIGFGSADAMKSLAAHICGEARMYGYPLVILSVETASS